jgi:DNA-binding PadR family transcriptional regulator
MSLPHAVLTSLLEKSSSGFDLARRFDKSIGYFWRASHQQIYRELARMEALGWIDSALAADAGKTRKREYRVLEAGRNELARWAAEPSAPMDLRDSLMVKLRASANLDCIDMGAELEAHVAGHRAQLAKYRVIEERDFAGVTEMPRSVRIQHMLLKKGILYEESSMAWSLEMLSLLKAPQG